MSITGEYNKRNVPKGAVIKVIHEVRKSGVVIFDDGTTGKALSTARLQAGDRVPVLNGQVLSFKWQDVRPSTPMNVTIPLIICHAGTDSDTYEKKFYNLIGNTLLEMQDGIGWNLTDDGKYGPIFNGLYYQDDPTVYNYAASGNGLGIPAVRNGIAAKKQSGRMARYILSGVETDSGLIEHNSEYQTVGGTIPVNAVGLTCSLLWLHYRHHFSRASLCRYIEDGVVCMFDRYDDTGSVEYADFEPYRMMHRDSVQVINKIFRFGFSGSKDSKDIAKSGGENSYILASAKDQTGTKQRILRVEVPLVPIINPDFFPEVTGAYNMAICKIEEYDLDSGAVSVLAEYCRDLSGTGESYVLSEIIEGFLYTYSYPSVDYYPTARHDFNLTSDASLISDIREKGKLSYIRVTNNGTSQHYGPTGPGFTENVYRKLDTLNIGVYCADKLIEETGEIETVKIDMPFCSPPFFPILRTNYNILHTHHDAIFDVVVYKRVDYVSHELDGPIYKDDLARYDRLQVVSKATYWVAVNGVKHKLAPECTYREYMLNTWNDPGETGNQSDVIERVHSFPYVDVGYDRYGADTGEDNGEVSRIFTTATSKRLLLSFDVFPVKFRHQVQEQGTAPKKALVPQFVDTASITFPPSLDDDYPDVSDRKWMLFDVAGILQDELTPPQKQGGGHIPRINGLVMLDPMD
jgi:hypothetical protein